MPSEPRKRGAAEFPGRLTEDSDETTVSSLARPGGITGGTLLVMARVLSAALWTVMFFSQRDRLTVTLDLEPADTSIIVGVVLACTGSWVLLLAVLAVLIWRGSNRARLLVLCGTTLSVLSSAAGYFAAGEQITIQTTLLTLSLDILLLLALSSRDARAWSRAMGQRRRERRAAARQARQAHQAR